LSPSTESIYPEEPRPALEKPTNSDSIPVMDLLSLEALEGTESELDLFTDPAEVDPLLLEQGLHPPLPLSGDTLAWGFGLLRQAARMGLRGLPVRSLPPLPGGELIALALRLEGRAGDYSWREKENMLRFVRRRAEYGESVDLATLSPWIEGHPDSQLQRRIERFAGLPPTVKEAVTAGRLDLKSGELAARLPAEITARLDRASLSFSRRRRFLTLLLEVSRRDRLSASKIEELARRLLEDEQPLEALADLRYPTLTGLREDFAALADSLWKGSGVRIDPPPYFEGEGFSVAFEFTSPDNLARKLQALRKVAEHTHELFALLR
jgi:hypothetical protein